MKPLRSLASHELVLLVGAVFFVLVITVVSMLNSSSGQNATTSSVMQTMQVCAVVFLVGVLYWLIPQSRLPEWLQRNRFPTAIALISILLLLGHRFFVSGAGLGFGLLGSADEVSSGIIFSWMDNLAYASFPAQASLSGVYTFLNAHTTRLDNPRINVNLVFLLVGKIAGWLNAPPFAILVCLGLVATVVVIFFTYWNTRIAGFSERAARWATIFVAFATGLSVPAILLQRFAGLGLASKGGADLQFQDALTFTSFYAYPFHTIAYGLLSIVIFLTLILEDDNLSTLKRCSILGGLAFAAYLLCSTHPYEAVMLLATYSLYLLLGVLWYRKPFKRGLSTLIALTLGAMPATALNYWISQQPVWADDLSLALAGLWHARTFWIVGYGVVLWLAVIGALLSFRRRYYNKGNWLAIWSLALFFLLIIVNIPQSKVLSGGYIPFAILAGFAADLLQQHLGKIRSGWRREIAYAGAGILIVLLFSTTLFLYTFMYQGFPLDREIMELGNEIKRERHDSPTILSDDVTSLWLVSIAPVRAYVSHWALTPDFHPKIDQVTHAGLKPIEDSDPPDYSTATVDEFIALVHVVKPNYLVLSKESKAYEFATALPDELKEIRCLKRYCLYSAYP